MTKKEREKRRKLMVLLRHRYDWSVASVAELLGISRQAIYKDQKVHAAAWEAETRRLQASLVPDLIQEIAETPENMQRIKQLDLDAAAKASTAAGAYQRLAEISSWLTHEALQSAAAALRPSAHTTDPASLQSTPLQMRETWTQPKKELKTIKGLLKHDQKKILALEETQAPASVRPPSKSLSVTRRDTLAPLLPVICSPRRPFAL